MSKIILGMGLEVDFFKEKSTSKSTEVDFEM